MSDINTKLLTPLKAVVGMYLSSARYWVLDCDLSDFAINEPNSSGGCQAVDIWFDQGMVEIDWGSDKDLVAEHLGYAYHVVASSTSNFDNRPDLQNLGSASWHKIPAEGAILWQSVIGKPLEKIRVLGISHSPQAIEFSFPSSKIVISIGSTSGGITLSDGDELLIFSELEWQKAIAAQPFFLETLQTLWQISSSDVS